MFDEYIKRSNIYDKIKSLNKVGGCAAYDCDDVENAIKDIPAADAVEVVRCRDCVHFVDIGNGIRYCSRFSNEDFIHFVLGDNFCSYGERRNN